MSKVSTNSKPVVFIGAGDAICGESIRLFAKASKNPIVLADSDDNLLQQVATQLPDQHIALRSVDLFDPVALRNTIAGAALVVQGAQPYYRTSEPVITACIDAKVPYLDFSDDVQSTQKSLALHARAQEAGVPCYINCGSSPGLSNLLAVDIYRELDTTDAIDICWVVGSDSGVLGRHVMEHLMHITAGPCLTWANGKPAVHENWIETDYIHSLSGANHVFHESVHPEPVTLPRRLDINRIRTLGALSPAPFNGFARGLGAAVHSGALSMETAINFLEGLQTRSSASWGRTLVELDAQLKGGDITLKQLYQTIYRNVSSLKPWTHALWGMIGQVRQGECTVGDIITFFINFARGKENPPGGGMIVRGVGMRNGHPAVAIRRTPDVKKGSILEGSMATLIGGCCAAFALMVLDMGDQQRPGVFCPEDWAESDKFFQSLEKLGFPKNEVIESL